MYIPSSGECPSVAWDGSHFLVVWEDYRTDFEWDIYGARVNSDGAVLDPDGIPVDSNPGNQQYPEVAAESNSQALVVCQGWMYMATRTVGVMIQDDGPLLTYTITPMAGANGSIIPSTPVTLDAGQSTSFVVSANADYYIASLTTNGSEVGGVAGLYGYTSWWNNVQADGTITVAFASITNDTAAHGTLVPWLRQYYTNEANINNLRTKPAPRREC
jgi:hypothetical protein